MKFRHTLATLGAIALSIASIGAAHARQIYIQQSGSSPAGGDPNQITNTGSFIVGLAGNNSSDKFTGQDPLLIIVGVYNGLGTPTISFSGCAVPSACPAATVGTYGLTSSSATFTSGDAYAALGLAHGNSESFVNWSGADQTDLGLAAPTSFTLYAFQLNVSLAAGSTITIDESGAARGSYIMGYDCLVGTGFSKGCGTIDQRGKFKAVAGDILDTPFTNAGLIATTTSVPEPGTLLLFSAGLAGLGLALSRRRKSG